MSSAHYHTSHTRLSSDPLQRSFVPWRGLLTPDNVVSKLSMEQLYPITKPPPTPIAFGGSTRRYPPKAMGVGLRVMSIGATIVKKKI